MYSFAINIYRFLVAIAAVFHKKARLLRRGHRAAWDILLQEAKGGDYVWFHAASLGEFEQGRPLIERLRKERPHEKILLTFFSPSGYEVCKNYEGADIVCYLPFDTRRNARRFLRLVRPKALVLIKYEFWRNYINACYHRGVPVFSVSSIFREKQVFFRPWGRRYARSLRRVRHFFVQNEHSRELLSTLGISQVSVVGDTRFDRVIDIREKARRLPVVEAFAEGRKVLVCGSSWPVDEEFLANYFNEHPDLFLILAPHVVSPEHLLDIEGKLRRPSVRLSGATEENVRQAHCLIIDGYGLLSSIYRYGCCAYVGGGFGVSIHNVPEAAVYGIPVIIGPNNRKFKEAQELLACGGCLEIPAAEDFAATMDHLLRHPDELEARGKAAGDYIYSHSGATERIYQFFKEETRLR